MMHEAFEVHILTDEGKKRAIDIATAFDELHLEVIAIMRSGEGENPGNRRYEALVATKLEEACFFAKKGMSQHYAQGK